MNDKLVDGHETFERKRADRAPCRVCGKKCAVKRDGTARKHNRSVPMWGQPVECEGSGQPVVRP